MVSVLRGFIDFTDNSEYNVDITGQILLALVIKPSTIFIERGLHESLAGYLDCNDC